MTGCESSNGYRRGDGYQDGDWNWDSNGYRRGNGYQDGDGNWAASSQRGYGTQGGVEPRVVAVSMLGG